MDNKWSRKDPPARKWWQNFEGIKVCWNTHYCGKTEKLVYAFNPRAVQTCTGSYYTQGYTALMPQWMLCVQKSGTHVVNHIQTPPVPSSTYELCDVQTRALVCAQREFYTTEQVLRPAEDWAGNPLRKTTEKGKAKVHLKSWCFLGFMCGFIHDLQLLTLGHEDHNFSLLYSRRMDRMACSKGLIMLGA